MGKVGEGCQEFGFGYIKLEIPVRNLRKNVGEAGGYNGPSWR